MVKRPTDATDHMYTVIYVMGYGRSGSTILDILLNQHPDVLSGGEVGELYRWLGAGETCACHAPIRDCAFWRAVSEQHFAACTDALTRMAALQRSIESLRNFPALLLSVNGRRRVEEYRRQVRSLFGSMALVSGRRWIVDSSKSAHYYTGRALALERYAGLDVRAIHLVRDPRAVGWSMMRGEGSPERQTRVHRPRLSFVRALGGWTVTNALACVTARRLRRGALRVRYEDLCVNPGAVLQGIGEFVGLDVSEVIRTLEDGASLQVGHNIAGNRIRFQRRLAFRPDEEWREKLPGSYRRAARMATWPLCEMLGYREPASAERPTGGTKVAPSSPPRSPRTRGDAHVPVEVAESLGQDPGIIARETSLPMRR